VPLTKHPDIGAHSDESSRPVNRRPNSAPRKTDMEEISLDQARTCAKQLCREFKEQQYFSPDAHVLEDDVICAALPAPRHQPRCLSQHAISKLVKSVTSGSRQSSADSAHGRPASQQSRHASHSRECSRPSTSQGISVKLQYHQRQFAVPRLKS